MGAFWRRGVWLPLLAVVVVMVGLRLYHVGVPLVDTSDWRQTDTAAIAYFYYKDGIALLHPQLWHDGAGPDYTQLELQLTPALAALLAHVFGYSDVLLRMVAIAVDAASVLPLWALVRRRLGTATAFWSALVYAVLPLGIFFGRVFQPEPAMLLTGNLALWAADRFGARPRRWRYAAAVALLAVAVMAKLPNAMLLLPACVLAYGPGPWLGRLGAALRHRASPEARRRLRTLAAEGLGLCLVPAAAGAAYTVVEGRMAGSAGGSLYVTFIIHSLGSAYIAGSTSLWRFLWHNALGMAVTPAGGGAAALGLWWTAPRWRRGRHAWLLAWGLALAAYAVVVLRAIRLQYYLIPLLPWIAVLCGIGLHRLASRGGTVRAPENAGAAQRAVAARRPGAVPGPRPQVPTVPRAEVLAAEAPEPPAGPWPSPWRTLTAKWGRRVGPAVAGLLVLSMLSGGLFQISAYWPPYMPWYRLGEGLRQALPAQATLLVGGTFNPTIFYYARRHGWRMDPITAQGVEGSAADYLVPAVDPGPCMDAFLRAHFPWQMVAGTPVYNLKAPIAQPPLPASPAAPASAALAVGTAGVANGTAGCAATGSP